MTESGTRDTYAIDHYEVVLDRPGRTIRAVLEHPAIDVTWSRYAAGQRGPDLHVHRSHVDAFYILEGELQFKLGAHASPAHAPAGTFVLVPPNVPHTFNNESTSAAQWLNIHSPSSGFLAYIRGDRTRFDQHDPPADGGPTRLDAIVRRGRAGELIERDNHKLALLGHHPQLSATEIRIDAGFTSDPRAAGHHVDYFFALEGEIEFSVGDSRLRAGPGTWTTVPLGVPAGFRNVGSSAARLLALCAPGANHVCNTQFSVPRDPQP